MKRAIRNGGCLIGLLVLSACGYVDAYEEAVYEEEPRYCYRQLGGIQCFAQPVHRDAARLVNYYGPHPSRFETPSTPKRLEPAAPRPVSYYAMDEEPVPDDTTLHPAKDTDY